MAAAAFDLIVIGAGPGGYVAAIRAAQLGWNVACIEKESALGGTCLRVGCIPSKALLESSHWYHAAREEFKAHGIQATGLQVELATMLKRKDQVVSTLTKGIEALFTKNKVTRFLGEAQIQGVGKVSVTRNGTAEQLTAKHILIATGSKSATLPGVTLDGQWVGTSTEALTYPSVPQHLVVIGAGAIGLELGSVWKRLGAKVTVLEYLDRILPGMDSEIAQEAKKILEKQGLEFRLGTKVTRAAASGQGAQVECADGSKIECTRVLLSVGRVPNTDNLGLASVGIELDARGRIPVDGHFATKVPSIFAIGDVIRGPMLAHKAEEEGVACVERLITGYGHVDYDTIPSVVYTHPEIASVGKTEDELKQNGEEYRKGSFPFLASGRARAMGTTTGRVKILADAKTDRVLGVHILGPCAGELIAEAATAMSFHASAEDIARACHAHPTLAEAVKEAALAVHGRAIHV